MKFADLILLVARLLAGAGFVHSGYGKFMAMAATKAYFTNAGVPMPEIAYWVAVVTEIGTGALLILGLGTTVVAPIMAAWCIATAFMAHANFADAGQLIHFKKNMAMAGGYLAFMVAGAGRISLDAAFGRRGI